MHRFALSRFSNGETDKTGITQASQRRYVHYFNDLIENKVKVSSVSFLSPVEHRL